MKLAQKVLANHYVVATHGDPHRFKTICIHCAMPCLFEAPSDWRPVAVSCRTCGEDFEASCRLWVLKSSLIDVCRGGHNSQ